MKRILIGLLSGGLSLSALTVGSKAAQAGEPCEPPVVVYTAPTDPAYYGHGHGRWDDDYGHRYRERAAEIRYRDQLRWEARERWEARRRWEIRERWEEYRRAEARRWWLEHRYDPFAGD